MSLIKFKTELSFEISHKYPLEFFILEVLSASFFLSTSTIIISYKDFLSLFAILYPSPEAPPVIKAIFSLLFLNLSSCKNYLEFGVDLIT